VIEMTTDEIDALLADARIGRLCMADPTDGRPYAVPLPFCWADGALYLRLPLTGRKGEVLARNPLVCFEVDACTDALDEYASVLIEGRLVPVTDLAEKARVKRLNDAKYERLRGGHRPGHGRTTALEALPMRKVVVERLAGRRREPAATAGLAAIAR
jgi:nitroimidazol reductase NimA-like FMN-containing flavoprotein (pyridoxamine 5'-phosphate oxidase superfamily)